MDVRVQGDALVVTTDAARAGWSVGQWLREGLRLPDGFVRRLFREGRVMVGRTLAAADEVVPAGRRLRLVGGVEADHGVQPPPGPDTPVAEVLWEDDHLLVVNKPSGLLVHPGGPEDRDTLDHRVAAWYLRHGLTRRVLHAHRLDRDTTGIVLYAKHAYAARALDGMVARHEVRRLYLAITDGTPQPPAGRVDAAIGRDRHVAGRYRVAAHGGKPAVTYYRTLGIREGGQAVVECRLETGRTHQVRVHLAALGTPVVGDALYGAAAPWPAGHALHAWRLVFTHPYDDDPVCVEAPLPVPWRRTLTDRVRWLADPGEVFR